jgi:hypothetical protein
LYRSAWYYQEHRREHRPVRQRIKEIAETRVRYGYNRIYILLRREGWKDNGSGYIAFIRKRDLTYIANDRAEVNPLPERIQVGNGSDFISKDLDRWAYENKVTLDYSSPGKPTDNPFIESFNGTFRDECLNVNNTVYSSLELGMAMETRMQEAKVIFSWWCRVSF